MGTELVRHCIKEETIDISPIPPGFESLASMLKKVNDNEDRTSCSPPTSNSQFQRSKVEPYFEPLEGAKTKCLRRRSGIKYDQFDKSSDDESDPEQNISLKPHLPKGVIHEYEDYGNCLKVTAQWRPEGACRPDLQDAPVFYPTEEEFEDTLSYIEKIRPRAEAFGICRIVPPASWKPPCPLKEKNIWEKSNFITRIQRIDKLQNRNSMAKKGKVNHYKKKKRRRCTKDDLKTHGEAANDESERFGFETGPEFTLGSFQKYADDFKAQYFRKNERKWEPSLESIEGEYWRMVLKPTEEIEVLYGADLETGTFGSGFPKQPHQIGSAAEMKYIKSGWNLNNFPKLPGSVLSYESSDISGVLVPWLYIGMCFSSFCWHVEDHHLYSLNYLHWGAPKMWYGVPSADALKLEATMRKHLPALFDEQPDLLHKLVTQLSPSILKSEGVPVYRCTQNSGEFVLTFPRAYHAGFNCGFNCAEAVNVAPMDWLPHGENAIELYSGQRRRTSISHDKLLLGAARDAVKAQWELSLLRKNTKDNLRWKDVCGRDGVLTQALKTRIEMERVRREFICNSSQTLKMESTFDATCERECSVCFFDLHLSAAGCHNCSPKKYACLNHAKQLCSCSEVSKFFLFRYNITELNLLVEALGGKLSSIYRWARQDLGLSISAYSNKENQVAGPTGKSSCPSSGLGTKEVDSRPVVASPEVKKDGKSEEFLTKAVNSTSLVTPHEEPVSMIQNSLLGVEGTKLLSSEQTQVNYHISQECTTGKSGVKASIPRNEDVIVLSDDEIEEPEIPNCSALVPTSTVSAVNSAITEGETSCAPDSHMEHLQQCESKLNNEGVPMKLDVDGKSRSMDDAQTVLPQNNFDRCFRQKGPRIAKVVRRINCNVEALNFGVIQRGKLWCDARAIYPKGFRSRTRYIDVLDPTDMCYYVSEILDAGQYGPMFMVSLERCPSEVFIHMSAVKCWEMVQERLNQEIATQHRMGKTNLPPLQLPGSLDGLEMFGLSSPEILHAIEGMDQDRVCLEYWNSRRGSVSGDDPNPKLEGDKPLLSDLFKRANTEELEALHSLLQNNPSQNDQGLVARLLNEEIHRRRR